MFRFRFEQTPSLLERVDAGSASPTSALYGHGVGLLDPDDATSRGIDAAPKAASAEFWPKLADRVTLGPLNWLDLRRDNFLGGPQPNDEWSRSLEAPTKLEPRPDGSVWEIRGPIRVMVRPPDGQLAQHRTQPDQRPRTDRPTDDHLAATREQFQSLVALGKRWGYHFAADNLEHFLNGSGAPRFHDPNWLRTIPKIRAAESRVRRHFEDWMTGDRTPTEPKELITEDLQALRPGQSLLRSSHWDGAFNKSMLDMLLPDELFLAVGKSAIKGRGDFIFRGEKGSRVRFEGTVTYRWEDPYDWDTDGVTQLPTSDGRILTIDHLDAIKLQDHGGAKPFMMQSEWRQGTRGVLHKWGDRLILESTEWFDIP